MKPKLIQLYIQFGVICWCLIYSTYFNLKWFMLLINISVFWLEKMVETEVHLSDVFVNSVVLWDSS